MRLFSHSVDRQVQLGQRTFLYVVGRPPLPFSEPRSKQHGLGCTGSVYECRRFGGSVDRTLHRIDELFGQVRGRCDTDSPNPDDHVACCCVVIDLDVAVPSIQPLEPSRRPVGANWFGLSRDRLAQELEQSTDSPADLIAVNGHRTPHSKVVPTI